MKKRRKTTRKGKKTLYYFYMDGCHWCKKFNPTWVRLVKEFKGKLSMKKINGPSNEKMMKQFGVETFPTVILVSGNSQNVYKGDRSMKDLKKFLK